MPRFLCALLLSTGLAVIPAGAQSLMGDGTGAAGENRGPALRPIAIDPSVAPPPAEEMLDSSNQTREAERLRTEYLATLSGMEAKKQEQEHESEVQRQAKEFSRQFLKTPTIDPQFPEFFAALLKEFPLASEDEFCRKLMNRAAIVLRKRGEPVPDFSAVPSSPGEPVATTEPIVLGLDSLAPTEAVSIDAGPNFQTLRERLRSIEATDGDAGASDFQTP